MTQKRHPNVFLSLSTGLNLRSSNYQKLVTAVAPTRILVESDYHDVTECAGRTLAMVGHIAEARGWSVEDHVWSPGTDSSVSEGVTSVHREDWGVLRRLEANWRVFERGGHKGPTIKPRKKKIQEWSSPSDDETEG